MTVSGHQPVYLPWLGLFHKLYLSDVFVYMDTVQYLEQDWNNRNKIRTPQGEMWLIVPVDRKRTAGKLLHEIRIKQDGWQDKHWTALEFNYKKSRYWSRYATELHRIYQETRWDRLVDLCWEQFLLFSRWLDIRRNVVRMSEREFAGTKDELVLDHCRRLGGDRALFGAHGRDYVRVDLFRRNGIRVVFQDYNHPTYSQRFPGFRSHLSVLDLVLNQGPDSLELLLSGNATREELVAGSYDA